MFSHLCNLLSEHWIISLVSASTDNSYENTQYRHEEIVSILSSWYSGGIVDFGDVIITPNPRLLLNLSMFF